MKTKLEVDRFEAESSRRVSQCQKCKGSLEDCECSKIHIFEVAAFEACIPRDFWHFKSTDIEHNRRPFDQLVAPYLKRLNTAHKRGYGLLFSGPNGVGKTTFISYVLLRAIRRGKTAYYTTMLQLAHDIKSGFNDPEAQDRLEWMLTSDFFGLDEMGKEHHREASEQTFMKTQVEMILKRRFDECKPTLLGTNLDTSKFSAMYGTSVASMVSGKYRVVYMEPGDIRKSKLANRMNEEMGY